MSLEIRSLYLAAYLLDFYFSLDQRSLDLRYCYLVAAACLMVACMKIIDKFCFDV